MLHTGWRQRTYVWTATILYALPPPIENGGGMKKKKSKQVDPNQMPLYVTSDQDLPVLELFHQIKPTNRVMSSAVSLPNHTFTGQA